MYVKQATTYTKKKSQKGLQFNQHLIKLLLLLLLLLLNDQIIYILYQITLNTQLYYYSY